jgi:fatty-acyl-CoA synthase
MAAFKVPKSVAFVEVLPKNPSGKLLKRELRQAFAHIFAGA